MIAGSGLELSDTLAACMRDMFQFWLHKLRNAAGQPRNPQPPTHIRADIVVECSQIAHQLAKAYIKPVRLSWDIDRYSDAIGVGNTGQNVNLEAQLKTKWPPLLPDTTVVLDEPCVLLDQHSRILAWVLPGVLHVNRQREIQLATAHLSTQLMRKAPGVSWRNHEAYFRDRSTCTTPPGTVNLSPGWHALGHTGPLDPMLPSASLRDKDGQSGWRWLTAIRESAAILSAMMSIMHPDLYAAGHTCMESLLGEVEYPAIVSAWSSIFNGVQVISNRETPLHRDKNSRKQWFDLLTTVGSYGALEMQLDGPNIAIDYKAGSVVALCGKLLRHGVQRCDGERICYAYFMRDSVHAAMNVKAPHWMEWTYG